MVSRNGPVSFLNMEEVPELPELTQVTDGINRVINVQNLVVVKCSITQPRSVTTHQDVASQSQMMVTVPDNVEHAINSLDMRQESISKSRSRRSTLDQASNISDLQVRGVHGRRLPEITQKVLHIITPKFQPHIQLRAALSNRQYFLYLDSQLTYRASGTAHLASLGSIVQNG